MEGGRHSALIEHWDGQRWSIVAAPSAPGGRGEFLNGVAAVSASDVWAVGEDRRDLGSGPRRFLQLVLHWDGKRWAQVPGAGTGVESSLSGVTALTGGKVWMVGSQSPSHEIFETPPQPLIEGRDCGPTSHP